MSSKVASAPKSPSKAGRPRSTPGSPARSPGRPKKVFGTPTGSKSSKTLFSPVTPTTPAAKKLGRRPKSPDMASLNNTVSDDEQSVSDSDSDSENNNSANIPSKKPFGCQLGRIPTKHPMSPSYLSSIANLKDSAVVLPNTKKVYSIVNTFTGAIGGNGSGGPIYGELTIKSMQKMVQMMKEYQGLDSSSKFIDVGAGLGKPNFHVAADPGVKLSYGIECEEVRWRLSLANLRPVLEQSNALANGVKSTKKGKEPLKGPLTHNLILKHGNIFEAKSFDPFTHIYMFDIGFPDDLNFHIAEMWKNSQCEYIVSYHGPKIMLDKYKFKMEFMCQVATSMHGSGEGHTGYFYKRGKYPKGDKGKAGPGRPKKLDMESNIPSDELCDPCFKDGYEKVIEGPEAVLEWASECCEEFQESGRAVRDRVPRKLHNV